MKKKLIIFGLAAVMILIGILITFFYPNKKDEKVKKNTKKDTVITTVYLVNGSDRFLTEKELKSYPSIKTVNTFDEVMKIADESCVSIWIDKNAVNLVDTKLLSEKAEKGFPVALIGYSNREYCFKKLLDIYDVITRSDFSKEKLTPGYSVGLWIADPDTGKGNLFLRGFENLSLKDLLALTDALIYDELPSGIKV